MKIPDKLKKVAPYGALAVVGVVVLFMLARKRSTETADTGNSTSGTPLYPYGFGGFGGEGSYLLPSDELRPAPIQPGFEGGPEPGTVIEGGGRLLPPPAERTQLGGRARQPPRLTGVVGSSEGNLGAPLYSLPSQGGTVYATNFSEADIAKAGTAPTLVAPRDDPRSGHPYAIRQTSGAEMVAEMSGGRLRQARM